jgi:hypothetical protein
MIVIDRSDMDGVAGSSAVLVVTGGEPGEVVSGVPLSHPDNIINGITMKK